MGTVRTIRSSSPQPATARTIVADGTSDECTSSLLASPLPVMVLAMLFTTPVLIQVFFLVKIKNIYIVFEILDDDEYLDEIDNVDGKSSGPGDSTKRPAKKPGKKPQKFVLATKCFELSEPNFGKIRCTDEGTRSN